MRKSLYIVFVTLMLAVSSIALAEEASPAGGSQGVVNINTADVAQLSLLPRVGEKAAQRIIDYRAQNGAFRKTSDLMQVKGFGAKTFERLSPYISLSGQTTLSKKIASPRKPRAKKPTATASN